MSAPVAEWRKVEVLAVDTDAFVVQHLLGVGDDPGAGRVVAEVEQLVAAVVAQQPFRVKSPVP